ncbi:hypothetical protein [Cognatilysobacter lacus]|uniref:Uncharacterized protein n=1 Tax=Cognatilysobacter lacus TaxID=1643323 RepID=A0A5D8YM34_9GAMM|nr:hypothetical protein [Lysobacter lacus]TZF83346.1 hypothetical protein FW784_13125 [Lysobacter lacus]
MDKYTAVEWTKALLATLGAFIVAGVAAGFVAGALHVWATPIEGFVAAFVVVLAAYALAPSLKVPAASLTLAVGAAAAWKLIGHSDFPESYGELAYQPTQIPFLATIAGGLLAWLIACLLAWRRRHSGLAPNNSSKPTPLRGAA